MKSKNNNKSKAITNLSDCSTKDLQKIKLLIGKKFAEMYKLNQEKEKSNST